MPGVVDWLVCRGSTDGTKASRGCRQCVRGVGCLAGAWRRAGRSVAIRAESLGSTARETEFAQIQLLDERINDAYRIVFADEVLEPFGKQSGLSPRLPRDESFHGLLSMLSDSFVF